MKNTTRTLAAATLSLGVLGSTATAATYSQNFEGFADGTTDLGDGSVIGSHFDDPTNGVARASVQGGSLRLTEDDVNSQRASFRVPAVANSSLGWTATFDFTMNDLAGGNAPADGFSFNYGNILPLTGTRSGPDGHGNAETGMGGTNITFAIDTWQIGAANSPGVEILADGISIARTNGTTLSDGGDITGTATISWSPGTTSFATTGLDTNADFGNVAHTFVGDDAYGFAFTARTGGANEGVFIDNLVITSIPEPSGVSLLSLVGIAALLRRRR